MKKADSRILELMQSKLDAGLPHNTAWVLTMDQFNREEEAKKESKPKPSPAGAGTGVQTPPDKTENK